MTMMLTGHTHLHPVTQQARENTTYQARNFDPQDNILEALLSKSLGGVESAIGDQEAERAGGISKLLGLWSAASTASKSAATN